MSLFERIKNKRYDLQEKRKFPGDESGAYQQAKDDLEARKGFSKNKPGGLKADEKNPYVKRSVRKSRVDKLGGDIYDAPKFSQKDFDKDLKKYSKGQKTGIDDPFATGKTSKKTFKNFRKDSGFNAKKKAIKDIRASEKRLYDAGVGKKPSLVQQRKFAKAVFTKAQQKQTAEFNKQQRLAKMYDAYDDGDLGNPEFSKSKPKVTPTKGVNQAEVSKKQRKFGKEINQARIEKTSKTNTPGYSQSNKPKAGSAPVVYEPKVSKTQVVDKIPAGSNLNTATNSGTVKKKKITKNLTRKNRGFTEPLVKEKSVSKKSVSNIMKQNRITGVTATGRPSTAKLPAIKDPAAGIAAKKEFARDPRSALLKRQNLRYLKAADKQKGLARGLIRFAGKLGPKGRLAAGGLTAFLATPGGRNFAKNLAIGSGLTAALGLAGKKEKVLKKGDGLKTVGKVDVRYGLTGTSKKGQGGKVYNPKQMAQLGKVQKNFIDKYNQKARINPFKKQIQYKPKADGTYKILDPKKK